MPDAYLPLGLGEVFRAHSGDVAGAHRTADAYPRRSRADQPRVADGPTGSAGLSRRFAVALAVARAVSHGGQHGGEPGLLASGAALRA